MSGKMFLQNRMGINNLFKTISRIIVHVELMIRLFLTRLYKIFHDVLLVAKPCAQSSQYQCFATYALTTKKLSFYFAEQEI